MARTGIATYRRVLAQPGVGALAVIAFLTRVPASAAAIALTLHVVIGLGHGYAAAGAVGAASTIGMAVGAPLLGRLVDHRGLRTMIVLTLCAEVVFWGSAPWLSYPALLAGAALGGLFGLPVYSVVRQAIAAMVPTERRRPAFALDSMSVELSYIVGPALGTLAALQVSTVAAMLGVGAGYVLGGIALWVLNPPTRAGAVPGTSASAHPTDATGAAPAPRAGEWLNPKLVATLLATVAAAAVVFGTELSVIAGLERTGQSALIGVVIGVWCLASLTGGYLYGAAARSRSLFALVGVLGAATLPVAIGGPWWILALLLIPAGLACAPSLIASADAVAALAPDEVRGLVTGLQGSAITLGGAIGAPLAGALIDTLSPAAAILTTGLLGIGVAGAAALVARRPAPAVTPLRVPG